MAGGDWRGVAAPQDIVNTMALVTNTDEAHHIRFRRDGELRSWTLAEFDQKVLNVARRLRDLGAARRDRVGVLSENRIEWALIDHAVLKLGGVTAAVEPGRFTPEHITEKYGLKLLFGEGVRAHGAIHEIDEAWDWANDDSDTSNLPAFAGYDAADICQVKQTSGSTGIPKGIETTAISVDSSITECQVLFSHTDGDDILVFLPLWFLQQRWWIYSALFYGHDVSLTTVPDAVAMAREVRPTVMMGVPRIWDDIRATIIRSFPAEDLAHLEKRREAIQQTLGGRIRYLWTGSGPASVRTLEFFNHGGVPLYEGYGQNETCIVAKNHPGAFRLGSVGRPLPNKAIRFDDDGVLIVDSRYPVNTRYTWSSPGDNEKIWLATGEVKTYDQARLDEDGFLYLLGRVDDVISPSFGPNVLVTTVEDALREVAGIADCCLFGNSKRFVSAIVVLSATDVDYEALATDVGALNATLRSEQRVHAMVLATEPFSLENGLLTRQFKPRRKAIHKRYQLELDEIYEAHNDDPMPPEPPLVVPGRIEKGQPS